jgi:adenylate cyclase
MSGKPELGSALIPGAAGGEKTMGAPLLGENPDTRSTRAALEPGWFDHAIVDGEVVAVSVLFVDLRGFTSVAEHVTPRRMAGLLNGYFTAMVDVILARRGMIQDFVGDGILAVFGAPSHDPDHAWHAALSAVELQTALRDLGQPSDVAGHPTPTMGVAVHSGEVFAGTVGSPRQWKYAAVGDTVNVASRLEELNRDLGTSIVMSGETIALVKDRVEARSRGWFTVRGRSRGIEVFELLALRPWS